MVPTKALAFVPKVRVYVPKVRVLVPKVCKAGDKEEEDREVEKVV
jgi:hypothetical protein